MLTSLIGLFALVPLFTVASASSALCIQGCDCTHKLELKTNDLILVFKANTPGQQHISLPAPELPCCPCEELADDIGSSRDADGSSMQKKHSAAIDARRHHPPGGGSDGIPPNCPEDDCNDPDYLPCLCVQNDRKKSDTADGLVPHKKKNDTRTKPHAPGARPSPHKPDGLPPNCPEGACDDSEFFPCLCVQNSARKALESTESLVNKDDKDKDGAELRKPRNPHPPNGLPPNCPEGACNDSEFFPCLCVQSSLRGSNSTDSLVGKATGSLQRGLASLKGWVTSLGMGQDKQEL